MNAPLSTSLHDTLSQHASTRAYSDDTIPAAVLDRIIEAGWRGPTSINGQQVSLVVIQDPARRAEIAKIAGGQPWIAQASVFITVVMDFSKTALGVEAAGKQQVIHDSVEGAMVGAVDAGITLGRLMAAAQAEGLGVVPIGGIRRDPQAMIKLLDLPPLTFPLVGMALGHPTTTAPRKPRLPLSTFRHDERYQAEGIAEAIAGYDRELLITGRASAAPTACRGARTPRSTTSRCTSLKWHRRYAPRASASSADRRTAKRTRGTCQTQVPLVFPKPPPLDRGEADRIGLALLGHHHIVDDELDARHLLSNDAGVVHLLVVGHGPGDRYFALLAGHLQVQLLQVSIAVESGFDFVGQLGIADLRGGNLISGVNERAGQQRRREQSHQEYGAGSERLHVFLQ